jgi:trigger factor
VKTDVEELSPTRVKLTIEVPFEELKSSLDKAYREVARQVRVPGFRPGHVPPRVIDQRIGRGAVLEQAVNDAVPQLYGQALQDNDVFALGQPDLEITKLDDGKELAFTAEVDVRPKFDIPDLEGMPVTVENAEVSPDDVEEYIGGLRERFASLKGVDRAVSEGDYVSIDLSASVDGEPVDDAQASGLSYEVGTGSLLDGLDEALAGMSAGDTKTFTAELAGGERAGQQAEVTVTVHSVKVKELPELDDDFAQSASEFDTLGELRAGTRSQLETVKRMQQAGQARDRALDALLARIDMPLPESMVANEVEMRGHSLDEQLERAGATRDAYLEASGVTAEQLAADMDAAAKRSVKAGFVLDQVAVQEELGVEQAELNNFVIEQAYRMGVQPDRLAKELADRGQIASAVAEVLRAKALALIAERAAVTDEAGRVVDLKALARERAKQEEDEAEEALEAAAEASLVAAEDAEVAEEEAEIAEEEAEIAEERAEAAAAEAAAAKVAAAEAAAAEVAAAEVAAAEVGFAGGADAAGGKQPG